MKFKKTLQKISPNCTISFPCYSIYILINFQLFYITIILSAGSLERAKSLYNISFRKMLWFVDGFFFSKGSFKLTIYISNILNNLWIIYLTPHIPFSDSAPSIIHNKLALSDLVCCTVFSLTLLAAFLSIPCPLSLSLSSEESLVQLPKLTTKFLVDRPPQAIILSVLWQLNCHGRICHTQERWGETLCWAEWSSCCPKSWVQVASWVEFKPDNSPHHDEFQWKKG